MLEPAIIVIFGITGDLSKRKLLPALYHLYKDSLLNEKTVVLGVSRREVDLDTLLKDVELCVNEIDGLCDQEAVQKLKGHTQVMQMDISEGSEYDRLHETLDRIEADNAVCMNRLYYLSIPPQVTEPIIKFLGEHDLNKSCVHNKASTRLLVEKPFGYDSQSALDLISTIRAHFEESQVYRIDHYLAKETAQNILTFRANNVFESIWDKQHISHIFVNALETITIEGRDIFYEQVGALRDFVQSHLIQLLALVTLDLPSGLSSDDLHKAKLEVIKSLSIYDPSNIEDYVSRGQYDGYRDEVNDPGSRTETFAAVTLKSDADRWQGVPIFLRTGKALGEKITTVKIVFKPNSDNNVYNDLTFNIQPKEGITLDLKVKKPGFDNVVENAAMNFSYQQTFNDHGHPDAYERVLVDAVKGDQSLFATSDEVMASWQLLDPLISHWANAATEPEIYSKGSAGPVSVEKLVQKFKTVW